MASVQQNRFPVTYGQFSLTTLTRLNCAVELGRVGVVGAN